MIFDHPLAGKSFTTAAEADVLGNVTAGLKACSIPLFQLHPACGDFERKFRVVPAGDDS